MVVIYDAKPSMSGTRKRANEEKEEQQEGESPQRKESDWMGVTHSTTGGDASSDDQEAGISPIDIYNATPRTSPRKPGSQAGQGTMSGALPLSSPTRKRQKI